MIQDILISIIHYILYYLLTIVMDLNSLELKYDMVSRRNPVKDFTTNGEIQHN